MKNKKKQVTVIENQPVYLRDHNRFFVPEFSETQRSNGSSDILRSESSQLFANELNREKRKRLFF